MILLVAATEKELQAYTEISQRAGDVITLVSGIGAVESTLNLSRFLSTAQGANVQKVIHFGVGGAFQGLGLDLLDICLAEKEILADFGICWGERTEPFDFLSQDTWQVKLDQQMLQQAGTILRQLEIPNHSGNFITVNGVSGHACRGNQFRDRYQAICENMEGFGVARVCQQFQVSCLEIRCISNMVEDRNRQAWKIPEACRALGTVVSDLVKELQK